MAVFEFGPFVLDSSTRALLRNGNPQTLAPKTFDVLLFLVERRARVVSKNELLETLWPGTFVDEGNLSQQIFLLRRLLGGDTAQPAYIATVPKHGYRFVGGVVERNDEPVPPLSVMRSRRPIHWRVASPIVAGVILGFAVLGYLPWGERRPGIAQPRIVSVTSLPGLESFPSISPDGNFVVFSWTGPDPDGVPDLWISAVDRDSRQRLTETPAAEETSPAWSPNGRDIAFVRTGEGVFIVPALGGPERRVTVSGSMVTWMPDGRSLLVRDGAPDAGTPYRIFRIDLETFTRTQVTHGPSGIGDSAFAVSPNGQSVAFVRYERPGVGDVYVAPLDGDDARRRTDWNTEVGGVAWTSDGREIVYAVVEEPGLGETLFRIRADGTAVARGVRALHVNAGSPSISRQPGESARLAFADHRTDVGLRLIDLRGSLAGDVLGTVSRFADATQLDVPGRFSTDGEQIAFVSDRNGWARVWVANRDGSRLRPVTTLRATELMIGGWSRDGTRLVVDAAVDGNSDVYIVHLDGRPSTRLTSDPSLDLLTAWSSDEHWIYFSSNRSGSVQIWRVSVNAERTEQVTRHGGVQPQLGPDGRTIFYLDRPPAGPGGVTGASTLKSVPVSGGEETTVIDGIRFGLWSVTNGGIAFVTIAPQSDAIDFYPFADRIIRRLGVLPFRVSRYLGLGSLAVDWHARWALVNVTDQWESDIKVADGFR
jgi:Tol biopolymer transport system component/DNA-binding winged helix-turn-helix (wHTH) protein